MDSVAFLLLTLNKRRLLHLLFSLNTTLYSKIKSGSFDVANKRTLPV